MKHQEVRAEQRRLIELDGVRGLAALLVIYAHLYLIWIPGTPAPIFWLRTITGMSWTGVYLFYILSGFLIGGILLRNRPATNYFQVFYWRRALRILPVYFALLLIFALLRLVPMIRGSAGVSEGHVPFWQYFLLVQNFSMARTGEWGAAPLAVTWSVALEEQFYLFLPLWICLVPTRWLPASFLGLAAVGPVFRAVAPFAYPPFLVPGSAEALFIGAWLAWIFETKPNVFKSTAWRGSIGGMLALGALGMALLGTRHEFGVFSVTIISVFWSAFLWLVLAYLGTIWTAPLRQAGLLWIGSISYTVYLFHQLMSFLLFTAFTGGPMRHGIRPLLGFGIATLSLVCTLAVALVAYYGMEKRLVSFGRRSKYKVCQPAGNADADEMRPASEANNLPQANVAGD
jgi:peptidoglycan/LPS O-acetylase OafA/YrhL